MRTCGNVKMLEGNQFTFLTFLTSKIKFSVEILNIFPVNGHIGHLFPCHILFSSNLELRNKNASQVRGEGL